MAPIADALLSLGPLAAFHAHNPYRGPGEVLDELLEDLLHQPRTRSPYLQNPEHRRSSFRYDLDLLTRVLGWAGIVDRVGATVEPDRWGHRDRLADGTLQLTSLGRWWLATR